MLQTNDWNTPQCSNKLLHYYKVLLFATTSELQYLGDDLETVYIVMIH